MGKVTESQNKFYANTLTPNSAIIEGDWLMMETPEKLGRVGMPDGSVEMCTQNAS
jgi:hypothetical protein